MDLSQVKLRKTETKDKSNAKPLTVLCKDSEDFVRLMEETYLEKYYDSIEKYSFRSVFVPLSGSDLEELIKAHQLHNEKLEISMNAFPHLNRLASSINDAIKQIGSKHVFIRLSSRSPKDAALTVPEFKELFQQALTNLQDPKSHKGDSSDLNDRLHALYTASTRAMCIAQGIQGINLLIQSSRIQDDMQRVLDTMRSSSEKPIFNIVVREFLEFDVQYEFRAFIVKKVTTAITQYNEFVYFPSVVDEKEKLESTMKNFLNDVAKYLPIDDCVVDLVLVKDNEHPSSYRCYIVELNPLAEFAGSGLFTWTEDMDILLGKKQFEFRINTSVPPFAKQSISSEWAKYVFPQ